MKLQPPLLALLLSPIALSEPLSISTATNAPTLPNANHIFNAITSALRQWGSSWNHNGMSIFRASVPTDVLLYHGRGDDKAVTGMEWLAFEAEHAMMFARRMRPPPGKGRDGSRGRDRDGEEKEGRTVREWGHESHDGQLVIAEIDEDSSGSLSPFEHSELLRRGGHSHKQMDNDHDGNQDEDETGYLHHYRTLRDLNLLYIDGQSAGKTSKGTLDTQDYLLLGSILKRPMDEMVRARDLCNLTRTIWNGKIDGFIRMECGFEILLCEFEGNVGLNRAQMVRNDWRRGNDTEELRKGAAESAFRIFKALSDRFWGIGESRAEVNFERFVTAFSKGELDLFEKVAETEEMLPRLRNISKSVLESLKDEVTEMVQRSVEKDAVDWQRVSDMYVQRYASPLQALLLPNLEMEDFRLQLELLMWVFVSDSLGDEMVESMARVDEVVGRCIDQFLPRGWNNSLAGRAVHSVSSRLCGTLTNVVLSMATLDVERDGNKLDRYARAREEIGELVSWLNWPIWRYCSPGCVANEVCVLPIWPITGGIEDRKRPNCKNATMLADQTVRGFNHSYWYSPGEWTGPPNGRPHRGEPSKGHDGPGFLE